MSSDDEYTGHSEFKFASPQPDGNVEYTSVDIEWNENDIRFTTDKLELAVEDGSVEITVAENGTTYPFETPGFDGPKPERDTCPNLYCENYMDSCEKHDEYGNSV